MNKTKLEQDIKDIETKQRTQKMADITMCLNTTCRLKHKCYRYTAPVSQYRQSYSNFQSDTDKNPCKDFIDNRNYKL